MKKIFSSDEIIHYFDTCEVLYRHWWDLDRSLSMHVGYWDKTTKTLSEALARENEILAEMVGIRKTDKVLDAGCGVGGSALFLAARHGCHVTGITLSAKQVEIAQKKAEERGLSSKAVFLPMDYTKTSFPDASFDVVWAIESVCYAKDKRDFIKEAWRLLRPGGRLIVADGFTTKVQHSGKEEELIRKSMNGWAVHMMESSEIFEKSLHDEGFKQMEKKDITANVLKSSVKIFLYSIPAIGLFKLGKWLGFNTEAYIQNFKSAFYQYFTVRKKLAKYLIFQAEK